MAETGSSESSGAITQGVWVFAGDGAKIIQVVVRPVEKKKVKKNVEKEKTDCSILQGPEEGMALPS